MSQHVRRPKLMMRKILARHHIRRSRRSGFCRPCEFPLSRVGLGRRLQLGKGILNGHARLNEATSSLKWMSNGLTRIGIRGEARTRFLNSYWINSFHPPCTSNFLSPTTGQISTGLKYLQTGYNIVGVYEVSRPRLKESPGVHIAILSGLFVITLGSTGVGLFLAVGAGFSDCSDFDVRPLSSVPVPTYSWFLFLKSSFWLLIVRAVIISSYTLTRWRSLRSGCENVPRGRRKK